MARSLTSLVNNLSEGLHKDKCIDCKSCLDYMIFKANLSVKRITKKKINKDLIKRFVSIYEFCNKNINKFIFLLRKGIYPYEYMDSWERFECFL